MARQLLGPPDMTLPHRSVLAPIDSAELDVVGISVSANQLTSVERFFRSVPVQSGLAFLVIQDAAGSETALRALLASCTQLPVHLAADGAELSCDTIYVLANAMRWRFEGRRLRLSAPASPPTVGPPADDLLRALAAAFAERALAVVLTGAQSESNRREIEDVGGCVLVRQAPEQMPALLLHHLRQLERRQLAEHKLADVAQQLLAAVVDGSQDAIVSKTTNGVITSWNSGAQRLFGYTSEEALGRPIMMLIPERLATEEQHILDRVLHNERVAPFDTVRRRKDGSEVSVSVTVSPVRDATGRVVGASKIARDITLKRLREAQLRRSNEELEQFAYVASHDLQEPLRMVINYAELLTRRYAGKLDDTADKYLGFMSAGARRMQALIQDLLMYSRVDTQGQPLIAVDSERALARAVLDLKLKIQETNATIVHSQLPKVLADEGQLCEIFQNLVGNALKYRSARIEVTAVSEPNNWRFAVKDNGIGFDMEHAGRIFKMFQRLHTRDAYPGSGIGLAIVKRIVERHEGRLWVESAPGQGSTFYFTLPRVRPGPAA
jgi:PAS domain S-box-containing protein